ncbi:hypothetical protein DFJ58DRAFT_733108 [Suillus subalutaceus]|uniref:uncharacterized protein n=1 Tax=Suillus subalutaceus TaxID=48586 RepID=UPI001B85F257|nr:uncharacterized protein DFJ58DRAFT_733108 [Suillus subalutaceus]KAG1839887.1 hypothetical protein DFJ58DRAFT_733108 [Suillus subalutaceus]
MSHIQTLSPSRAHPPQIQSALVASPLLAALGAPGGECILPTEVTLSHVMMLPPKSSCCFAMKAIRRNHQSDITLDDVIKGRDLFLSGLSSLSDDTITLVANAKHAARENSRQKLLQLSWEIEEAKLNKLVLIAFEEKEKKHLQMADSDYYLFKKLLLLADEQLFQMSSISSLATKYVSHRFPQNSSDTEYEPGEEEQYDPDHSDNGSYSDNDKVEERFPAWTQFQSQPSGQPVITQLKLLGDHATTPDQYQVQMNPSLQQQPPTVPAAGTTTISPPTTGSPTDPQQYELPAQPQYQDLQQYELPPQPHLQALQQYALPPQPQYQAPEQYELPPQPQYQVPQQYEPPLQQHQLRYQAPQEYEPPPQHQQHQCHERNMGMAQAQVYAGAFALLQGEGSRLPLQPDLRSGTMAPWGASRLIALAPYHVGENVRGEQTQGVIRTVGDDDKRRTSPPTPTIPMAAMPNAPAESTTDSAPISTRIALSTKELYGQVEIEMIKGIHNYMVASLADMRHALKVHALKIVPLGYSLRLPLFSPLDHVAYKQGKIETLLDGKRVLTFTVDGAVVERLLENEVLIDMVIEVLIGGWSDVLEGPMDRVFASCGAVIYCVMYAHRTGQFIDVSVNSSTFDDAYQDIIAIIQTIRASDVLSARFDGVQQEITI